jgi:hypothetical protein
MKKPSSKRRDLVHVLKAFAFALFLNSTSIYLLVKKSGIVNLAVANSDAWGFGVSWVLGALITYILHRRKHEILSKYNLVEAEDSTFWWLYHFIFSALLFMVVVST